VVCHPKLGRGVIVGEENDGRPIVVFDNKHVSAHVNPAELSNSAPSVSEPLAARSVADIKAPDPAIASALGQVPRPFTPGAIAAEPLKSQPSLGGEAITAKPPTPAPPSRFGHRVWHEEYGLGRVIVGEESGDHVAVWMDCQTEVWFKPADLKRSRVSHPEHGDGFVLAVGGAGYSGHGALTDEELAELSDGELIVSFGHSSKRRVNAAEVSTTNLCVRQRLSFNDTSAMLTLHAEGSCAFNVETVLQDYFSVEHSSDIPAEALDQLLTRIGLDEKGIAAIRTELSRKPVARAAPWFEPGARVQHQEHAHGGCVVLGSESLADNDGKVLVQFNDGFGEGHGPRLLVDPAELMLTRIWHPEHGLGTFLFEDEDGEVCVVFDDKDSSSHVMGAEISTCVPFDPKSLADRDGKMVRHPYLGHGLVVGEEDGKLIVVFDDRDGSAHVNSAVSLATKSVAEIKAPDSFIASALGQMEKPFTPGAIAAEKKPLETDHSAACLRDVPSPGRCPETRGTPSCD
jgi:hypothetical protein